MNEKLFIYCRECGELIIPDEYQTLSGDAWFFSGNLYIEMTYRCPKCGNHNIVNVRVSQAEILEVC